MEAQIRPSKAGRWSEPALRVLTERYLARRDGRVVETPEEMCWRVAQTIANAESRFGRSPAASQEIAAAFYDMMVEGQFLPNSPTLMNAGKDNQLQYSACYVLPVGDSMEEIFDSVKAAAIIHQSGGGTGFAFSRLRPKNDFVRSTGGRASGPVSFLKVFNSATEAVKQGGTRRGANMGVLRVDHPDILEFVECKLDGGMTNFNISVAVTDSFMSALEAGGDYDLINPRTGMAVGRLSAQEVFDRIVRAAWRTGDPGLVFIDRINASPANPTPQVGLVEATNPCLAGETLVATDQGLMRMDELVARYREGGVAVKVDERLLPARFMVWEGTHNVPVASYGDGCLPISQAISSGERETVRLRTRAGFELVCTPDHRVMTDRGWTAAGALKPGEHRVWIQSDPGAFASDPRLPFPGDFYEQRFSDPVVSVEPAGVRRVYDLTEPQSHSMIANGLVVHQCGEQPLLPNEACNLGSLNVARFAREQDGRWSLDWDELERVVRLAVRFLDDVIEVNPYPLAVIDAMVKANRRIGLGVMGWADLLFALDIPYDSAEALELGGRLMAFIQDIGHDQSARLAEERGPFPNYERSIYTRGQALRNSTVTTIAPTGTISMIAGCSSGIEPVFALAFEHRVKGVEGERVLPFVSQSFERIGRERGFYSDALMVEVARRGTLAGIPGVPEAARAVFKTAHEIHWSWHVRHQAAFQRHTDNGVSKTINLPADATGQDVADAYLLAWREGCLGITVFRDGCKGGQVLNLGVGGDAEAAPAGAEAIDDRVVRPRPHSLAGATYRMETPIGTAFVTVNETAGGDPFEVFVQVGKAGSDTMAVAEALGRLISLVLRLPSPLSPRRRLEEVISQLAWIGGGQPTGFGAAKVLSLPDALARTLGEHIGIGRGPARDAPDASEAGRRRVGDLCKECGQATLVYEEGCKKCLSCGFNEC
ncbi:MAG TPA: ribonucleotide reductase N-terminal alpha domain-containing protein [Methylomirabilota bacterium]|jgi:ribonucleoside-diphosphate reductase alpha chain|nr:ribonucleotide reductase N-terminal alpha domain-containing protein [Methylomirabilota bacterium]